jgi:AcrR family transcriptional regulator
MEERHACLDRSRGASALDRLLDFVDRDLSDNAGHKVAMPFLGGLAESCRQNITSRRREILDELIDLIEQGLRDGSIRSCHPATIGQVVLNFLERFVVFDDWLATAARTKSRDRITQEVVEIIRQGILAPGVVPGPPSHVIASGELLVGVSGGLSSDFDRYEQIMRVATRAFNAEGAGASIPRMAQELGVSKTVIYHFAVDKRDLLSQCYLRGVRVLERSHQIAIDHGLDALDEIVIHRNNLFLFHASDAGPFTLLNALDYLLPQQQRVLEVRNAAVRAVSEDRLRRAIEDGAVRDRIDPQIAQALFGQALYGLPSWYSTSHRLSVAEVAVESGLLLFKGLQR